MVKIIKTQSFDSLVATLYEFKKYRLQSKHPSMRLCRLEFDKREQKVCIVTILVGNDDKVRDGNSRYRVVRVTGVRSGAGAGQITFTAEVIGQIIEFKKDSPLLPEMPALNRTGFPVKRIL
jgi:hypothetical protein